MCYANTDEAMCRCVLKFYSTALVQTIVLVEEKFWQKYILLYKLFIAI